ncbi:uncharacterized protein LOC119679644 [Teleopsis dalmanni]|uniref:uncharacterized protein LOC119679644 n=1 Tax=Teleopsis dalmanni TaxID=139649 RepID=UPI0018CF93F3|nr:uncharacterized protein LOC119679644 [Teleopsis dalmanni]
MSIKEVVRKAFGFHKNTTKRHKKSKKVKTDLSNNIKSFRILNVEDPKADLPTKQDLLLFIDWIKNFEIWKRRIKDMRNLDITLFADPGNTEQMLISQYKKMLKTLEIFDDMMNDFSIGMSWFSAVESLGAGIDELWFDLEDIREFSNKVRDAWFHISNEIINLLHLRSVVTMKSNHNPSTENFYRKK